MVDYNFYFFAVLNQFMLTLGLNEMDYINVSLLFNRFHAASNIIASRETENWQKYKESRDYYQFIYGIHFSANDKAHWRGWSAAESPSSAALC
jgi:hypothetical protein